MKLIGLFFVVSGIWFSGCERLHALPDAFYYFDNLDTPLLAEDSGGGGLNFKITEHSHITEANAKVGKGNLLIQQGTQAATTGWYAPLKDAPEFSGDSDRLTVTVWVRPYDSSPLQLLSRTQFEETGEGRFRFGIDGRARLVFAIDEKSVSAPLPTGIPEQEWMHLAMSFEQGRVNFYVNGELLGKHDTGVPMIPEAYGHGSLSLGLHSQPGVQIDDVGIFGKEALGADAIRAIYQNGLKQFNENK